MLEAEKKLGELVHGAIQEDSAGVAQLNAVREEHAAATKALDMALATLQMKHRDLESEHARVRKEREGLADQLAKACHAQEAMAAELLALREAEERKHAVLRQSYETQLAQTTAELAQAQAERDDAEQRSETLAREAHMAMQDRTTVLAQLEQAQAEVGRQKQEALQSTQAQSDLQAQAAHLQRERTVAAGLAAEVREQQLALALLEEQQVAAEQLYSAETLAHAERVAALEARLAEAREKLVSALLAEPAGQSHSECP